MKSKVSLIVPSKINQFYLEDFLTNILFWTKKPNEIIVINTYHKRINLSELLLKKFFKNKINVKILNKKNLFPGAARNCGVKIAKFDILCFLDVNTVVYNVNWLEKNINFLKKNKIDGILGKTYYLANNVKEEIIIASTFGFKELQTLPGTIIKKKIFNKIGLFNNQTRAGEDTEWLLRVKKSKYKFKSIKDAIFYKGLYETNYIDIMKKWYRNYYSSSIYKHLYLQKILYITVFFITLLFLITAIYSLIFEKIIIFKSDFSFFANLYFYVLLVFYFIFRGIYLPFKKNIKKKLIIPNNFIKIILFSISLDVIKAVSFSLSTVFNKNKIKFIETIKN